MEPEGSVTLWIGQLKQGDEEAARRLWERYFERLIHFVRDKKRGGRLAGADRDEEDVALSALNAICLGAAEGKFPKLDDRGDLWALLMTIAARKTINLAREHRAQKRGGGRVLAEADLPGGARADNEDEAALARVVGSEPTPEFAALIAEEFRVRLEALPEEILRRVAILRLEGYANEEIAAKLGCTTRTIVRKVEVIRRHWSEPTS